MLSLDATFLGPGATVEGALQGLMGAQIGVPARPPPQRNGDAASER